MACQEMRKKIELKRDGALDPVEGPIVSGHLEECSPCREYQRVTAQLGEKIREYISYEVGALPENAILSRVEASLGEVERGSGGWVSRYWKVLVPALAGAIALSLILFYPSSKEQKIAEKADVIHREYARRDGRLNFAATVESLEARDAEVVLVDRGVENPKVIWIIDREDM